MAQLSQENKDRVNLVLKQNHLIQKINILLEENGLHDFAVKTLELQPQADALTPLPRDCQEGYELRWVCHNGSSCEMRCVPIG